jgi:hypothetical protein
MRNLLVVAGLGFTSVTGAKAEDSRYVLDVRPIKGSERSVASLRDKKRQRVVWTRELMTAGVPVWSSDRRAVLVQDTRHILIWREGKPLRDVAVPKRYDYLMGCALSPGKNRVLLRCGVSGMADLNVGALYCLEIGGGRDYKVFRVASDVRDFKWRSSRTALYRAQIYEPSSPTLSFYPWRSWRAP